MSKNVKIHFFARAQIRAESYTFGQKGLMPIVYHLLKPVGRHFLMRLVADLCKGTNPRWASDFAPPRRSFLWWPKHLTCLYLPRPVIFIRFLYPEWLFILYLANPRESEGTRGSNRAFGTRVAGGSGGCKIGVRYSRRARNRDTKGSKCREGERTRLKASIRLTMRAATCCASGQRSCSSKRAWKSCRFFLS